MPEGPECAATARSLDEFMNNKTIVNIEVLSGRYLKKKPEGLDKVRKQLPLRVWNWNSKGKFIYGSLGKEESEKTFIWNTLGMSGYW